MTRSVTDAIAAAKRAISRILCLRCLRAGWEKSHFAWYDRIRVVSQIYCSEYGGASWANIAQKIPLKRSILLLLSECVKFLQLDGADTIEYLYDWQKECVLFYGGKKFSSILVQFSFYIVEKLRKEHDGKGSLVYLYEPFVGRRMQLAFYERVVRKIHLQARFRRHYLSLSHRKQTSKHVPLKLTFATHAAHDEESWWSALKRVRQHRS